MAYYINEEQINRYEFQEELLGALENSCDESFEEFLDEVNPPIEIMGITYDASFVLKNVDPIAYDICRSEYIDNLYQDKIYLLEDGETLTIDGDSFMID